MTPDAVAVPQVGVDLYQIGKDFLWPLFLITLGWLGSHIANRMTAGKKMIEWKTALDKDIEYLKERVGKLEQMKERYDRHEGACSGTGYRPTDTSTTAPQIPSSQQTTDATTNSQVLTAIQKIGEKLDQSKGTGTTWG